jgi:hypothetical protein
MKSLRSRLVLSHTLPILVLVPVIGVILVYALETQVLLANASTELTKQAYLIAELANVQDGLWEDTALAQSFVTRLTPIVMTRVMLLDGNGLLVASSDPDDAKHLGQLPPVVGTEKVQILESSVHTEYSRDLGAEVIDVLVPITTGAESDLVLATRLARRMVTRWGVGSLGLVTFQAAEEQPFLGYELAQGRDYSEYTAACIDHDVQRLLEECHQAAHGLLTSARELLDRLVDALLREETICPGSSASRTTPSTSSWTSRP